MSFSFSLLRGKEKEKDEKKEKLANKWPKHQGSAPNPASVGIHRNGLINMKTYYEWRTAGFGAAALMYRSVLFSFLWFCFFSVLIAKNRKEMNAPISKKENEHAKRIC